MPPRRLVIRFVLMLLLSGLYSLSTVAATKKPNVLLIMADDVGFECYSSYGSEFYKTPNIDSLATGGARFTQAYSQPICTPTRVKIMTGKYNFRNYMHFGELDLTQPTFAKEAKKEGYRTVIAGKWQLSPENLNGPHQAGFDEYYLWHFQGLDPKQAPEEFKNKGSRFKSPKLYDNGKLVEGTEGKYGPDMVSDYLCDFFKRNKEQPFVAYYPMILVHNPFDPTPDSPDWEKMDKKRGSLEHFRDMVHYMDKVVGKLVASLEENGLRENTLVIVTGDNGTNQGITSPFPGRGGIKGGKGKTTDAGNRVAFVANWPGVIPAEQEIDTPIDFADLLPTIVDTVGGSIPDYADGQSLLPIMKGDSSRARGWVFQSYNRGSDGPYVSFVRDAEWKLYADGRLFHVPADWLEEHPVEGKVGQMHRKRLGIILSGILDSAPDEKFVTTVRARKAGQGGGKKKK